MLRMQFDRKRHASGASRWISMRYGAAQLRHPV